MDFEFTADPNSLATWCAAGAEKAHGFERRHALARAGGAAREVYRELAELGLTGLFVSEAHGGMGFGPVEAMVVMEELGRALVSAPFAAGALVAPTLLAPAPGDVQAAWLPGIASGEKLVVLAHQERAARYRLDQVATRAERKGSAWSVTGTKSVVPAGDEADAFLVPAHSGLPA